MSPRGRDETEHERLDRNLAELLGELRVTLPGVQVLFAFLLVVPFNNRFSRLTAVQEKLYLAALLCSALAAACLIAPAAHHRLTFRRQDKEAVVRVANRLFVAGLALLAVAMTAAIWLVSWFVFGGAAAAVTAAGLGAVFVTLWLAYPLSRRVAARQGSGDR